MSISAQVGTAQIQVLVDQVGYDAEAPKQGIIQGSLKDHPKRFKLIDAGTGKEVFEDAAVPGGEVKGWSGKVFWIADFTSFHKPGQYALEVDSGESLERSCAFAIDNNILERDTLSSVIFYFKGQRSTGLLDQADRRLQLPAGQAGTVDLHGGWYDATGDYGKHLSHQNLTSYFNPQQTPLVVWSLLKSYNALLARRDDNFSEYERRLLDEGLYGADFLVRMKRPDGSFFETVTAPGKEKSARDRIVGNPNWRTQIKTNASDSTEAISKAEGKHAYEVGFRSGGGMSIAALALASTMSIDGEFKRSEYLKAAEDAFRFLQAHNQELLNDGIENILDDYCALMAATQLYNATHSESYRAAADKRAEQLIARLTSSGAWKDYWRANSGTRPYFHPADAGLPVISLLEYYRLASATQQKAVKQAVEHSLRFELSVTQEVKNPFGYARQLVQTKDGKMQTAFFFPHDTEAAPWWQGENARLGSLAAAARLAVPLFSEDREFQSRLYAYAWDQLHWILGRNPFDTSMLMGSGHNNAAYMFFRSYKYTNAPGAIINGITSNPDDEDGIAFNLGFAVTGKDDDWRWTEEWLPHAAWYLYAISLPH